VVTHGALLGAAVLQVAGSEQQASDTQMITVDTALISGVTPRRIDEKM
jgi:hypothetical protein